MPVEGALGPGAADVRLWIKDADIRSEERPLLKVREAQSKAIFFYWIYYTT